MIDRRMFVINSRKLLNSVLGQNCMENGRKIYFKSDDWIIFTAASRPKIIYQIRFQTENKSLAERPHIASHLLSWGGEVWGFRTNWASLAAFPVVSEPETRDSRAHARSEI